MVKLESLHSIRQLYAGFALDKKKGFADADPVASSIFGVVERAIGNCNQLISRRTMIRESCDAKGTSHFAKTWHIHLFDAFAQAFSDQQRALCVCLSQDDHELVAAKPRRRVDNPKSGTQQLGQHAERSVANFMTGLVINALEIIQVEHYHGKLLAHAHGHLEIVFKPRLKRASIKTTRQAV